MTKKLELRGATISSFLDREWLVTNGLGGYAASTLAGMNTRRYHGLLVATHKPPTERRVHVSKIEETVRIGDEFPLSTNQFPNTFYPQGYQLISDFSKDPLPTTRFENEHFSLEKTVFMVHGSNTVVVEYHNTAGHAYELLLNPLFVERDFHALFRKHETFNYHCEAHDHHLVIYPFYGASPIYFVFSKGDFEENRFWLDNMEYLAEQARGMDFSEDVFSLGQVEATIRPGEKIYLTFSLDEWAIHESPAMLKEQELQRLQKLVPQNIPHPFVQDLAVAADQFLVKRESTGAFSVVAGYPWFMDWGRDAMIAIRGLAIALRKQEEARSVIGTFLNYLDQGMVPNKFPDYSHEPIYYNSVDAALWTFVAAYEYDRVFQDTGFIKSIFDQLGDIINWYIKGTRHNIHLTQEGLLYAGFRNTQLTWMDAQVDDFIITPRNGCPVEVNVLWYNALEIYEYLGQRIGKVGFQYRYLTELIKKNFKSYYWNKKGYLNDLVLPGSMPDNRIRPNQIYAVSLPYSILSAADEQKVVQHVGKHLLTDYGLRTLDPKDPGFKPRYEGGRWERDSAYHQGTVWPFLLGEYLQAYLKVNQYSLEARKQAETMLEKMMAHFYGEQCLQAISEVFDGKEPKQGKGCFQQAWSVGNLLHVILRNGLFREGNVNHS